MFKFFAHKFKRVEIKFEICWRKKGPNINTDLADDKFRLSGDLVNLSLHVCSIFIKAIKIL